MKTIKVDSYIPNIYENPFLTKEHIDWFKMHVGPELGRDFISVFGRGWKFYRKRHDGKEFSSLETYRYPHSWFLEVEDERIISLWLLDMPVNESDSK